MRFSVLIFSKFVGVKLDSMEQVRLIRVGSASDNDVVINHEAINAYHLELFQDARGNVFLSDLKPILVHLLMVKKSKHFVHYLLRIRLQLLANSCLIGQSL